MTVRDEILAALAAVLEPLVDTGGVEIDPDGDPPFFPSLAVFDQGDRAIEREAVLTRRLMDVSIEGYVLRSGGADGAADRNALHADAMRAIFADDTLGGLVELIEDGDLRKTTYRFDAAGRLAFAQELSIQFTTLRRDPALPA